MDRRKLVTTVIRTHREKKNVEKKAAVPGQQYEAQQTFACIEQTALHQIIWQVVPANTTT